MRKTVANKQRGYSLIELLIVVSIIGIIAAVIYPAYTNQVQRAGRTDAKTLLLQAHARQESRFGTLNRYAANMTDLNYGGNVLASEDNRYQVSVNASTVNTFTLQADPVSGSAQENDECGSFTINHLGIKDVKNQPSGAMASARTCWEG